MIIEVTDQNFEQEVIKSDMPAIVDFWASWCGPCRMMAPVIEKLERAYEDKVKFCKLNVDENQGSSAKYQIMSIPTLLFFKGGKAVDKAVGAMPEAMLKPKIEGLISSPAVK